VAFVRCRAFCTPSREPPRICNPCRALTLRIGLSVVLFVLLMLAWYFGLISPHGLNPAGR
jgi:hypothetical protein